MRETTMIGMSCRLDSRHEARRSAPCLSSGSADIPFGESPPAEACDGLGPKPTSSTHLHLTPRTEASEAARRAAWQSLWDDLLFPAGGPTESSAGAGGPTELPTEPSRALDTFPDSREREDRSLSRL